METNSDYLKLVELQDRVEKMERLVGNQQMVLEYHKAILAAASEHYKEDVEKSLTECDS